MLPGWVQKLMNLRDSKCAALMLSCSTGAVLCEVIVVALVYNSHSWLSDWLSVYLSVVASCHVQSFHTATVYYSCTCEVLLVLWVLESVLLTCTFGTWWCTTEYWWVDSVTVGLNLIWYSVHCSRLSSCFWSVFVDYTWMISSTVNCLADRLYTLLCMRLQLYNITKYNAVLSFSYTTEQNIN